MQEATNVSRLQIARPIRVKLSPHLLEAPHLLARNARDAAVLLVDKRERLDDDTEDEVDEEVWRSAVLERVSADF